jgi:Short C-terminal domain
MSFWEFFWFLLLTYLFIAYLVIMFRIVIDLFRDQELGGAMKGVWLVCLLFLPFLTALVYLISRGQGMAERSMADMEEARSRQDAYIRDVAGGASASDQIAQAKGLLDSGAINQAEYDALKAKALS